MFARPFMIRHFLRLIDIETAELKHLLSEAARLKADVRKGSRPPLLRSPCRAPQRRAK